MTNTVYPSARDAFLTGELDLLDQVIRLTLIDTAAYAYSDSHTTRADLPGAARIAEGILTVKSVSGGVFSAGDVTLSSVTGNEAEAIVLWQDSGTESTSRLIAYLDTALAGLPVTPNGGDITIAWPNGGVLSL